MRVINAQADKTGKQVMYAFNLSDDIDQMLHNHDFVLKSGGTCVMVSLNSMGLPAVAKLRQHSQLPFMVIATVGKCSRDVRLLALNS